MKRIKLLYLTPHLSTGGMPQFALKRIQKLNEYSDEIEIFVVEYSKFSDTYVVQRNSILEMIDSDHFFTLGDTSDTRRKYEIIQIIKDNDIDLVHSEEMLEGFESFNKIPADLINMLYSDDRSWRMIETCHNIWFDPKEFKKLKPDAYSLISPHHTEKTFASESSYKELHLYPYENKTDIRIKNRKNSIKKLGFDRNKKNVLNVGLWTSGKNQGEGIEIARFIESSSPDVFFHFVGNLAPNFENYWGDITKNLPSNVKIWGERDDVDEFMIACDAMMFNSTWECNPLVIREAIGYGMKILARNLPQYYNMYDGYITPIEGDIKEISGRLIDMLESDIEYQVPDDSNFGRTLLDFYRKVMEIEITPQPKIENDYEFIQHFVGQPYFELRGSSSNKFKVEFSDGGKIIHSDLLNFNSWSKLNRKYYTKWDTTVYENGEIIYKNSLDLRDRRVYIAFGSKSLGDTLAWIPYMEEFRKIHNCELIVSTFINHLFIEQYPNITFVNPGETVNNLYAQYNIGWYYDGNGNIDYNKVPNDFRKQPLQKTATDILGLEYKEIKPRLNLPNVKKKKKVGIGFHSTAQAKYWNNPNGWQEVIDHLNSIGYECMIYSREGDGYMNNAYPKNVDVFKGGNLQDVINDLCECEFFIGLGSGLSWLAWSCKLPIILISGFSERFSETSSDTYRIINEDVCHGCFNSEMLDAGDWNWCPLHKNSERMFECTKQINSNMVTKEIDRLIGENHIPNFDWGWMNDGSSNGNYHKKLMYNEIFEQKIYERFFEVDHSDIVLDVGSSVGPFTYSILKKNPKHVFCIEPSESEFTTLVKNTLGNPVTHINKGLSDTNGVIEYDQLFGGETHMESITFDKLVKLYGLNRIDFMKTDCEGGEYEIFKKDNLDFIKKNIKKIAGEWHLMSKENKEKFRDFRDNILIEFDRYEVLSLDGIDIKWDLWNEHFIEYYNEVLIYIDNR
jgi:autotransporter strand-loop-strand O-heptosyltransferase